MRALVTGGAGFIGSHLVERLLADDHQVVVIDDLSTGDRDNLPLEHPGLRLVVADAADSAALEDALEGCEATFHLAAVASVVASVERPLATNRVNLRATIAVMEASAKAGVGRFVYTSSAAVYGDEATPPTREDALPAPRSPYAIDKLAGEHYLAHYHRQHAFQGVALRLFNVYGPRQDPSSSYSGVISLFADAAREGRGVTVFGDGNQTRDFVYVADVADAFVRSASLPDQDEALVMNVGTGKANTLLELLGAIETLRGPIERRFAPERAGDVRHSRADVEQLRSIMGRVPTTPLDMGLRALLAEGR